MGRVTSVALGTALIAATSLCCSPDTTGVVVAAGDPGAVTNLAASTVSADSVTLRWTQVDDGTGQPASYALRYGSPTVSWGADYQTEVSVDGSKVGGVATYTYSGLAPGTDYQFQLVSYRGSLNSGATFGPLSNTVSATTDAGANLPVASVTVSPSSATIYVGQTVSLSAILEDANGNTLTGRSVSWTSSNAGVATVSSTGVVNGVAPGSANITATSEGQSGSATIQVTQQQTGSLAEPTYNPATDRLILRDNFDSYTNMDQVNAAYPVDADRGRQYVSLITGRGGTGHAIRLHYGPTGAYDILIGGGSGGPYTHFLFTSWFRSNVGGDPTLRSDGGHDGGLKGFMFWNTNPNPGNPYSSRYQFGVSTNNDPCSGYREARGPSESASNACTGDDIFKTLNGEAPYWSAYNDGNWHRFTVEIFTQGSGHVGARVWLDGVLIEDFVDNLGPSPYSPYLWPVTMFEVFGNEWSGNMSDEFLLDFDDWIAWTDGS